MSLFEEYSARTQREEIPGSIEGYLSHKDYAGKIVQPAVAANIPVMEFGSNGGVTDWLKQNWPLVAIGGVAVFALASK